jgi:hypothetical protein
VEKTVEWIEAPVETNKSSADLSVRGFLADEQNSFPRFVDSESVERKVEMPSSDLEILRSETVLLTSENRGSRERKNKEDG